MAEKSDSHKRIDQETSKGSGRPTKEGARKIYKKVQKTEDKHNLDYTRLDEGTDMRWSGSQRDNRFPVRLFPRDEYDTTVQLKQSVVNSSGSGPMGQATLTTDDLEWMKRKLEAEQQADFKQWVLRQFDLKDPAQRMQFQQMFSE